MRLRPLGRRFIAIFRRFATSDMRWVEERIGSRRMRQGAYVWRSLLAAGAVVSFGTDFGVEPMEPVQGLYRAVTRQSRDEPGVPPGGWMPEEGVSFEQALSGFTRDAAYAGFAEQKFGAIEPGKWADFIIVDRDISEAGAMEIARTQVLETWVAGKKVWSSSAKTRGERGK
jgi:hypothetical protein